jgi:hypothetical protein
LERASSTHSGSKKHESSYARYNKFNEYKRRRYLRYVSNEDGVEEEESEESEAEKQNSAEDKKSKKKKKKELENNLIQAAELLLEEGVDIDSLTENEDSALGVAVRASNKKLVLWLLQKGASVKGTCASQQGNILHALGKRIYSLAQNQIFELFQPNQDNLELLKQFVKQEDEWGYKYSNFIMNHNLCYRPIHYYFDTLKAKYKADFSSSWRYQRVKKEGKIQSDKVLRRMQYVLDFFINVKSDCLFNELDFEC